MLHSKFKIGGKPFTEVELIGFAEHKCAQSATPSWERAIFLFFVEWFSDNSYLEVKTSGSTGSPKTIRLSKKQMSNSAQMTGKFLNLRVENTALLCLPAKYIGGKMMLVRAMVLGLDIYLMEPVGNPAATINLPFDFVAMVPMQAYNGLAAAATRPQIESIGTLILGGGSISPALENEIAGLKNRVLSTYGMTETVSHIAMRLLNAASKSEAYSALVGITLSTDHRECLIIDAPLLAAAPVITNDVVQLHSSTSFTWLGRHDNVINSGGIKLHAEILEKRLAEHLTAPHFIAGLPDAELGQRLVLFVEAAIFSQRELDALQAFLSNSFERYAVPKDILTVSSFVRTPSGKLDRPATVTAYLLE